MVLSMDRTVLQRLSKIHFAFLQLNFPSIGLPPLEGKFSSKVFQNKDR